eukprot:806548-Rhodomonas_salina.1
MDANPVSTGCTMVVRKSLRQQAIMIINIMVSEAQVDGQTRRLWSSGGVCEWFLAAETRTWCCLPDAIPSVPLTDAAAAAAATAAAAAAAIDDDDDEEEGDDDDDDDQKDTRMTGSINKREKVMPVSLRNLLGCCSRSVFLLVLRVILHPKAPRQRHHLLPEDDGTDNHHAMMMIVLREGIIILISIIFIPLQVAKDDVASDLTSDLPIQKHEFEITIKFSSNATDADSSESGAACIMANAYRLARFPR